MRPRILAATLGLLCCAGLVAKLHANYPRNQGPTVQVSVQAVDTSGGALHYVWKSTDGNLISADAPTVTWTLPAGPGLHFAYVLVFNGLGGYTKKAHRGERRFDRHQAFRRRPSFALCRPTSTGSPRGYLSILSRVGPHLRRWPQP